MIGSEARYRAFLDQRAQQGLRRFLLAVASREARTVNAEGGAYVNFASNDYLGLRFNEALIRRAIEWADKWGVGSGASRLVTGNLELFRPIEAKLARLKGKEAALVMASGFQTTRVASGARMGWVTRKVARPTSLLRKRGASPLPTAMGRR